VNLRRRRGSERISLYRSRLLRFTNAAIIACSLYTGAVYRRTQPGSAHQLLISRVTGHVDFRPKSTSPVTALVRHVKSPLVIYCVRKVSMTVSTKPRVAFLLRGVASLFWVLAGVAFWVGGGLIHCCKHRANAC
jgi:hypothetical protein